MPETEAMIRSNGVGKALLAAMQDEVQKAVMRAMEGIPKELAAHMASSINVTLDVPSVEVPPAQIQVEPATFEMNPQIKVDVPPIVVPQQLAPEVVIKEAVIPAPVVNVNIDTNAIALMLESALKNLKIEPRFEIPEKVSKPKSVSVERDENGRIKSFTVKEG